jgi:hypothetical protein
MKAAALLFAIIAIIWAAVIALKKPAHAHDWYKGLKNYRGDFCCDIHDFKPVRAWQDAEGLWHALYPEDDGTITEYVVDPLLVLDDHHNKEPFQAHLAVRGRVPRCFLRKASGG